MSSKFIIILCIVSLGGLLFGFDMAVIAGALPLVKEYFGLSPIQEGVFVSSALIGCIIGVLFTGSLTDKYGRKPAFTLASLLFLLSAIGCGFSSTYTLLLLSRSIGGLGVGMASIVVPLYLAEISPSKFRGRSVTCYQLAITFGILIAYMSNYLLLQYGSMQQNELWRGMFLVGAIPALLLCIGIFFIPESPRWLSKNGRTAEVAEISASLGLLDLQDSPSASKGHISTLFSPIYRRAFLLGLFLPLFSQLSGINAIVYYGPSILLESGISLNSSYHAQIFFGVANVLFTFFAIWKVDNWGRRPLYIIGTLGASISLLVTGYFFHQEHTNNIALIVSILLFLFFFAFSIGPLKFVVAAEIFPNAIRARAMGISIMVMWISDAIVGQLTPILLASWGASYTFWLFAFFCALAFVIVLMYLPETKGKPLEDIEKYWIEKSRQTSTGQGSNP
ncbi:sugar porter family MFS transporter [Sphingobacterium sp. N143]|uniref:sugar porter family MFS transporter n=1 Tax=Sphingobacterium sp. N143 TaxID=2746727 RepID=UPI002574FF28|nr:sugar porter family MFS transporter [Sphingobacterium sp. N143]MDM1293046.1 sugar porter family MFS transporter [Sphingobacterium sp. N143]